MFTLDKVHKELRYLSELIHVPEEAFTAMTAEEADQYRANGMRISEIADLAIQHSQIK